MPQPTRTTASDGVGPIQPFPFDGALRECADITQDRTYWCFIEDVQQIMRMEIDVDDPIQLRLAKIGYGGVRIVAFKGFSYTTMSMSKAKIGQAQKQETPEQAYDRAMGVVGKRC